LHYISKQIVADVKENRFGIVMEKLTGLQRLYRKGNWQGRRYRARMNSWSYAVLQQQIEYKARWEGIPVIYVNPSGTSAKCSICGVQMVSEENRMLRCNSCGFMVDRDVNAAKNILARGPRFGPVAPAIEAMVQEPSREREEILKVDAGELT
jgi:IS605 OrfB family transposase